MSSSTHVAERSAEIARILETENDLKAFQQHLEEVLHGEAFRGSHRSGQFLRYVVNQAINGHCDELFGRSPSYDTGEDAIVRVTASDVRKRLLQHYGTYGTSSEFRIRLPLGSYIPEIIRDVPAKTDILEEKKVESAVDAPIDSLVPDAPQTDEQVSAPSDEQPTSSPSHTRKFWTRRMVLFCCLAIAVASILAVWLTTRTERVRTDSLWGALFGFQLNTKLVTSDPNIEEFQTLSGQTITLSDYANQRYVPGPQKVAPQLMKFSEIPRGDQAAAVDTGEHCGVDGSGQCRSTGHPVGAWPAFFRSIERRQLYPAGQSAVQSMGTLL
jgi:hypothetical protein